MKIFESKREIAAAPDALFDAFANSAILAKWWGPAGFTNAFEIFEFKQNGTWKFVMHGPDGKNYPNECKFLEISRPGKVVIRHASEPKFTLTVTITESDGGSSVHWAQDFDSVDVAKAIAHIVQPANEQNLDRLSAWFTSS